MIAKIDLYQRFKKVRFIGRFLAFIYIIKNYPNSDVDNIFLFLKEVFNFLLYGYSAKLKYLYMHYMLIKTPDKIESRTASEELFRDSLYEIHYPKNNPVIIDIGANIGISTLFFKKLFPKSIIYAFEPNPAPFEALKENISYNNATNVHIYKKAVIGKSSRSRQKLYYPDGNSVVSSLYREFFPYSSRDGLKTTVVEIIPFSSIVKKIQSIDILKVDAEGAEQVLIPEIVKYSKNIHSCIIEIHRLPNKNIFSLLQKLWKDYTVSITSLADANDFISSPRAGKKPIIAFAVSQKYFHHKVKL